MTGRVDASIVSASILGRGVSRWPVSTRPHIPGVDTVAPLHRPDRVVLDDHVVRAVFPGVVGGPGPQPPLVGGLPGPAPVGQVAPRRPGPQLPRIALIRADVGTLHSPPPFGLLLGATSGDVTTLGRGGSDASAVAVAAALGASECEIFTDVSGVFTADPRIVPDAHRLDVIRHEEMLEMAEAGAAVLQPRSVQLAMTHGIDIHLRSSFDTEEGTRIRQARGRFEREALNVAGIAHRRQESLYGTKDVEVSEVAAALAERGIALGAAVPRTGGLLEFTAPGVSALETTAALHEMGISARVDEDLGSVSVVGLGVGRRPDVIARSLAALRAAGVPQRLVTTMPGRVSVLVDSDRVEEAVRVLHATFVPLAPDARLTAGAAA